MTERSRRDWTRSLLRAGPAPFFFLGLTAWAYAAALTVTDGDFVYPLDDPYIHLAVAENLTQGHYGLNLAEPSSPASSVVWPGLLALGLIAGAGGWIALALNAVLGVWALTMALRLGDAVFEDANRSALGMLAALGAVLVLNLPALALIGMEHVLQIGLTLLAWLGLVRVARGATPAWPLLMALAIGPLVRYENLALTVPACAYLVALGHWRAALGALGVAVVGLAAFSGFLAMLGLPLLPTSVLAKTSADGTPALLANLALPTGWFLVLLTATVGGAFVLAARRGVPRRMLGLGGVALATAALHLGAGRLGWFARYEIYVVAGLFVALLVLRPPASQPRRRRAYAFAFVLAAAALTVRHGSLVAFVPDASRDIHEQHVQMHRFVADHWQAPIAVNDIGRVAFENDRVVLDLWGLASPTALAEANNPDPSWMDALAMQHGVEAAMLYAPSFAALPASWVPVADLQLSHAASVVPHNTVTFFARTPEAESRLRSVLPAFGEALPRGTLLRFRAP
ncbi:MAG: hypothetical protein AAFR95_15680 [Bacteroidota bacterium]